MSYSLIRESYPVARKPHKCIWCGQAIEAGAEYIDERSVYDGNMQNFAWHPECRRDSMVHFQYEEEFEPYENARPDFRLVEGARP